MAEIYGIIAGKKKNKPKNKQTNKQTKQNQKKQLLKWDMNA